MVRHGLAAGARAWWAVYLRFRYVRVARTLRRPPVYVERGQRPVNGVGL